MNPTIGHGSRLGLSADDVVISTELERSAARDCAGSVVVGNRTECEMAVGLDEPDAIVDDLLERGVRLAIAKLGGGRYSLPIAVTECALIPSTSMCSAALVPVMLSEALVHGLLSAWDLERIGPSQTVRRTWPRN